jgi:citrate synthase
MMTTLLTEAPSGLEGLVVSETTIGDVLGADGLFHYRGYDATELASRVSFEAIWHLVLLGQLPTSGQHARFVREVADARAALPRTVLQTAADGASAGDRMAALRTAWSHAATALDLRPWLDLDRRQRVEQARAIAAVGPVLVAAGHLGRVPEVPAGAATAACYLTMVTGEEPDADRVAALERYLSLTVDHGLNASTFTARTVTSTGADLGAVVVAALGALSGPLHGGAPSRALDMLDAIGTPERAEPWLTDALDRGQRLMGFGHRLYRTEDPRARLLRTTAQQLGGERVELALHVEAVARRLLRERKPDRVLDVNVEYHAAVVLEAVGLPRTLFTPTFALSRAIGWTAHALEQMDGNRIVRPASRYVGPALRPVP